MCVCSERERERDMNISFFHIKIISYNFRNTNINTLKAPSVILKMHIEVESDFRMVVD